MHVLTVWGDSRFTCYSNLSKVLALNSTENASSFCAFHGEYQ